MLRHMDGFEQFGGIAAADLPEALASAGYQSSGDVRTTGGASEGLSVAVGKTDGSSPASFSRTFKSTADVVVLGFAYKAPAARGTIVEIKDVLTLDWVGNVLVGTTAGTALPLLDTWYYFEIVVDRDARTAAVYINDGLDLQVMLSDTAIGINSLEVKWPTAGDVKCIDDVVFIDSADGKFIDRVGPVALTYRLPMYDQAAEWSPSKSMPHFELVNNLPPLEDEYIQSNISGARDSFLSDTPLPDDGEILAVGEVVRARKSDIDGRQLGLYMGETTTSEVLIDEMSMENQFYYAVFEKTPAGADWNRENLGLNPFGVIVRP